MSVDFESLEPGYYTVLVDPEHGWGIFGAQEGSSYNLHAYSSDTPVHFYSGD